LSSIKILTLDFPSSSPTMFPPSK